VHLFAVACFPAAYGVLRLGASVRQTEGDRRWFLAGLAVALPAVVASWFLQRLGQPLGPFGLYVRVMAIDHGYLHLHAVGSWLLLRGLRTLEDEAGRRRWFDFLAFAVGMHVVVALSGALLSWGRPTLDTMLFLPIGRLCGVIATAVLLVLLFESYGIYRVAYALALAAVPLLFGFVEYLVEMHRFLLAGCVLVLLSAGTAWLWSVRDGL